MKGLAATAMVLLPLLSASRASAQTTIDTFPQWNGTQTLAPFGAPNTATEGETVVINAGTPAMTSFQVEIGNCNLALTIRGEVYAYDTVLNRATGASLFESAPQSVPGGVGLTLVTFNTGSLVLAPGNYVLFITTSKDVQPSSGCEVGATPDTAYTNGTIRFLNNGTDTSQWTGVSWTSFPDDLAIRVAFAGAVPTLTPWTTVLLICGLAAVAIWSLRRRRRAGFAS